MFFLLWTTVHTHTQHTDAKPPHACTTHVRAHTHNTFHTPSQYMHFDKLIVACRQLGGRVPSADGMQRCGPQTHTQYHYIVHATAKPAVGYLERLLLGEVPASNQPLLYNLILRAARSKTRDRGCAPGIRSSSGSPQ